MLPKLSAIMIFLLFFTFSGTVGAEGGHQHGTGQGDSHQQFQIPKPTSEPMPDMTPEEHQHMMNQGTEDANASSGAHGHGQQTYEETGPNWPVLGTFAAINLAFICIGIWNKWVRRKEVV